MRVGSGWPAVAWTAALLLVATAAGAAELRLTEAVRSGDHAALRTLLDGGADVNAPQEDGATPLHWAVRRDDAGAVDLLLRAGADAGAANNYGVTPLSLACINRNADMVGKLLAAGADPNAATSMGETVLMTCAGTGSVEAVRALLDHGAANINATEASQGQTTLMWAVAQGYPEVARLLLERGASVEARTRSRSLLVSLEGGTGGTDPGQVRLGGFTPLLFAARQGGVESARLLLDAGADVNDAAPDGASALVVASYSGHGTLAAFLLEQGADPNAADAGYAPLHAAVLRGDAQLAQALLAHGADPNVRMTRGSRVPRRTNWWVLPSFLVGGTPYLLAAKYAEVEIMRILNAHGAEPYLATRDGTTPLMMAAGARWSNREYDSRDRAVPIEVARAMQADDRANLASTTLVLELGADVNAQNEAGDTALHAAVYKAWPRVVDLLVEHGGRLDVRNKGGKSPTNMMCHDDEGRLIKCPVGSGG